MNIVLSFTVAGQAIVLLVLTRINRLQNQRMAMIEERQTNLESFVTNPVEHLGIFE